MTNIVLAAAVSIDSLSVGIIYGMRRIKIPLISQLVIAMTTSIFFMLSMIFGNCLQNYLSATTAKLLGAGILFILGCWLLLQSFTRSCGENKNTLATLYIKPLGLVVKILKEPTKADTDTSGVIDIKEAFILGIALAMDAFGAGFGAAIVGFNLTFATLLVTLLSIVFLTVGLFLGGKHKAIIKKERLKYLPGVLLISISLLKIIF